MALGYTYQNTIQLIGSSDETVTLSDSYSSAESRITPTGGASKVEFDVAYTLGNAETSNTLVLKVESSHDGSNLYQLVNESVSGGTSTLTARTFEFVGATTAQTWKFSLPIDISGEHIKISAKESGVAANYGTVSVYATISGDK